MATETVYAFDQIAVDDPQYTSAQQLNWLWQSLRRNDGVAQDLDLALAVTSDGIGNVLTQNGAAFLSGRSYLLSGGPQTTALTPLPANDFRTSYAVVVRFTTGTATGTIVTIAGDTIANPGPSVNPSIVSATDVLLAYVLIVNTAGTNVYTVTDARTFAGIGPAGTDTFFGRSALSLQYASTGSGFTAIGFEALLNASRTNTPSTAVGYQALKAMTTGVSNTAVGYQALTALTTSVGSVAIGSFAGAAVTGAGVVTAIGYQALQANTTVVENTAVGYQSLTATTTGTRNTAVGYQTLTANTTGGSNTAVGYQVLTVNTTGSSNTGVGRGALASNTTGANNTAVGFVSLSSNITGVRNTAVGYQSLAVNTAGVNNVAIGHNALLANNTGVDNTAVGSSALSANTTGGNNTAVGSEALIANTTGVENTAVGRGALSTTTTGVNNGGFGFGAVGPSATTSNTITLGNSSITVLRCQVALTVLSDGRDKRDINRLPDMLGLIRAIKPVTFRWDMRERYATKGDDGQVKRDENGFPIYDNESDGSLADNKIVSGFISQDLKAVQEEFNATFLNLVLEENANRIEATPENLIGPAIKAIQELADKLDALTAKVDGLTRA